MHTFRPKMQKGLPFRNALFCYTIEKLLFLAMSQFLRMYSKNHLPCQRESDLGSTEFSYFLSNSKKLLGNTMNVIIKRSKTKGL